MTEREVPMCDDGGRDAWRAPEVRVGCGHSVSWHHTGGNGIGCLYAGCLCKMTGIDFQLASRADG